MEVGHRLEIQCQGCKEPIGFSVLDPAQFSGKLVCSSCQQSYCFEDETLLRQFYLFEALCRQIHASEEILGSTAIAMDVGSHHIKVPFNLLLTRLTSALNLKINEQDVEILFRIEPIKDTEHAIVSKY